MNIFYISLRNILAKPLSAILTLIMLIMGVGLVSLLILVGDGLEDNFLKNSKGIDMVVGAKGSPLQLILAAIYQIDSPTGNISRMDARKFARNPMVESVIELSFGDSYKGSRIIGTSHKYPEHYEMKLQSGGLWEEAFGATIGSQVAELHGLRTGDIFYSAHGTDVNAEEHGDHPFKVIGVFEPSGTVIDRLILTSHESIWFVHETPGDSAAVANRSITAMLVKFKNKMGIITLPRMVNQQTSMQAALPAIELNRLIGLFGVGIATLRIIAFAIMLLGAVSVFVSMINSLRERAYEMALLRSMGASRAQVLSMILLEALLLGAGGVLGGLLISRIGIWFMNTYASAEFGMVVDILQLHLPEMILASVTLLLCTLAAALPAWKTSRMDVSKVLASYD